MKVFLALLIAAGLCGPAAAQYRNLEVSPNGSGGVQGTHGNENFDIDAQSYGAQSGQVGGRRPGTIRMKPSVTPGNVGATQNRCYVDGNGDKVCM